MDRQFGKTEITQALSKSNLHFTPYSTRQIQVWPLTYFLIFFILIFKMKKVTFI